MIYSVDFILYSSLQFNMSLNKILDIIDVHYYNECLNNLFILRRLGILYSNMTVKYFEDLPCLSHNRMNRTDIAATDRNVEIQVAVEGVYAVLGVEEWRAKV